jgi:hypothetical protein
MKGVLHVDSVVAPCSSSLLVLLRVIVVTYDRKNRCNQLHQMAYRLPAYVIVFFFCIVQHAFDGINCWLKRACAVSRNHMLSASSLAPL